jgi:hypothetical protein
MDNHWKCLEDIVVMKKTDASITITNEAIAETIQQNKCLNAQLTGVWANAKTAANTARLDITDLRARLILELCDASALLFTEVKSLQGTLSVLSTALKDCTGKPPPKATEHTPGVEQEDAPHTEASTLKNASSISPPCNQATGTTVSPILPHNPTHQFDSS